MATTKRTTNYRSSVSGKYVQKDSARRRPKTTVKETDKVKASRDKANKPKARKTKRPRARTTATTTKTTARRGRSTRR